MVRRIGLGPVTASTAERAFQALEGDSVLAVVYEAGSRVAEMVCTTVRGNPRFDRVPLIAAVREVSQAVLAPVFASGADDYLPVGGPREVLEDKLRELESGAASRPTFIRARAILADPERQRRVQYARVLRRASYDVHFALDSAEVMRVVESDQTVRLVVADVDLPPAGSLALLETLRKRTKGDPIWIASGPAARRSELAERMNAFGGAAFHDSGGPPENLLFTINAVSMTPSSSQRSSPRILHCEPVSFRVEGTQGEVWGSTYNLSRSGLYLRTLTPAPFGSTVLVRLDAPMGGPRVELRGRVVWRKEFGADKGVPGPAGMGLQLVESAAESRAAFEAGYERLAGAGGKDERAA